MRVLFAAAIAAVVIAQPVNGTDPADGAALRAAFGNAMVVGDGIALIGEPTGGAGKIHHFQRGPGGWSSQGTLAIPAGLSTGARLGQSLALAGDFLLAGAQLAGDSTNGALVIYRRSGGGWEAGQVLNGEVSRGQLGTSIAVAGDLAFVGAPGSRPGGRVHIYRRSGSEWVAAGTIAPDQPVNNERFGMALAASGDLLAVGAPARDGQRGAVYLFRRDSNGEYRQEAILSAAEAGASVNSGVGNAVAIMGDRVYGGGPNAGGFAGTVIEFTRTSTGWGASRTFGAAEGAGAGARFGAALAAGDRELWIGASGDSRTGRVYHLAAGGQPVPFGSDSAAAASGFGTAVAVAGNYAAVGMPLDASGAGAVAFYQRGEAGRWQFDGLASAVEKLASITGGEVECGSSGRAGRYECGNTSLLSFLPIEAIGGGRGARLSGNWGWTDKETGADIAIIGRTDGTAFVDVSDPVNPRYLGQILVTPGANASNWTEIKTYRNYALITKDGSGPHGVQIFDLHRLRDVKEPQTFEPDAIYRGVANVHDILANDSTGYAYAVGSNGGGESCGGAYHIMDMKDPLNPVFAGCFADTQTGMAKTGYSHDAICVVYRGPHVKYQGREICVGSNENALSITDLTDKSDMKVVSRLSYPDVAYTHQGWWTEDHRYFYVNDELDETGGRGLAAEATRTLIFDFSDLEDPVLARQWLGTTKASDHNLYVKGNRMYQANYKAGLRIIDISDPVNPREVGFFDVTPDDDNSPGFQGSWNNYPFFRNGAILVNSIEHGIFMVRDRTQVVP